MVRATTVSVRLVRDPAVKCRGIVLRRNTRIRLHANNTDRLTAANGRSVVPRRVRATGVRGVNVKFTIVRRVILVRLMTASLVQVSAPSAMIFANRVISTVPPCGNAQLRTRRVGTTRVQRRAATGIVSVIMLSGIIPKGVIRGTPRPTNQSTKVMTVAGDVVKR